MNKAKIFSIGVIAASCFIIAPSAFAEKDSCQINQRKHDKAVSSRDRAVTRKDNLAAKREKQNTKWEKGKGKKRDKILKVRTKNYNRYSPDCFDSGTPPTVTVTPTHTEDSSSKCAGARNKEAKHFAKQTQNEESTFPGTKFDKKEERLIKNIETLNEKIAEYEEFLANNCSG